MKCYVCDGISGRGKWVNEKDGVCCLKYPRFFVLEVSTRISLAVLVSHAHFVLFQNIRRLAFSISLQK